MVQQQVFSKTATAPLERVKLLVQCQGEIFKAGHITQPYKVLIDCTLRSCITDRRYIHLGLIKVCVAVAGRCYEAEIFAVPLPFMHEIWFCVVSFLAEVTIVSWPKTIFKRFVHN